MRTLPTIPLKSSLIDTKMWLFFATATLALWHGILSNRLDNTNDLLITGLFWLVALFLLWKKRNKIAVSPQPIASIIGFLILGWILFRGISVFWFENSLVQLIPVIGFFGIALITSGWKGLRIYFPSFFTLFTFSVLGSLIEILFKSLPGGLNFTNLTAKISSFLLHYVGFDVTNQGVNIYLSQGSVEVLYFCTGGPLISLLFQLTLVLVLINPISWRLFFKLILGIIAIGFFLGIIRVSLLAVVVSDQAAFDFWHGSEGNQIFSLIAFSIWIIAIQFIYENNDDNNRTTLLSSWEENNSQNQSHESYPHPEVASINTLSLTSPRSWLLPFTGITITGLTVATIMTPQIGRREIEPLQFPSQITLSDWNQQNNIPLVQNPETNFQQDRLRSGQQYHYQQQQDQVTVALRFSSPTVGRVEKYIKQTYKQGFEKAYQQGSTKYLSNFGHYRLFTNQDKAYLSTCLTPTGESTVEFSNYVNKANRNVFDWQTLIPRLLGKQSLRERRCLWVHLSTPLNQDSPETSYRLLESVFQQGYSKWQSLFH